LFKLIVECKRGWSHYHHKCIKLFEEHKTWNEAKNICELNNATLISIHSKEENDFVWNLVDKHYHNVWIGGKRNSDNNRFEWINGKAFNYTNWDSGRLYGWNYVAIDRYDGEWRDFDNAQIPFLCEYIRSNF
jgi:hypothetical protein